MYNQEKLINIVKLIQGNRSLNNYAKEIGVDSSTLSRIMTYNRITPPGPDILKKIANSSKGIVTYIELMYICGYITDENMNELEDLLNKVYNFKSMENNVKNLLDNMNLNDEEKRIATNYANDTIHQLKSNKNTTYEQLTEAVLKELRDLKNVDADKIYGYYILKVANSLKVINYDIDNNNSKILKLDLSIFDDDDIEDIKKYIDFVKSKKNLSN